jgi:hypothetical protein
MRRQARSPNDGTWFIVRHHDCFPIPGRAYAEILRRRLAVRDDVLSRVIHLNPGLSIAALENFESDSLVILDHRDQALYWTGMSLGAMMALDNQFPPGSVTVAPLAG